MELPETLVYCSGRMTETGRVKKIGSWSKVLGGIACLLPGEAFPHHSFATHYDTSNMIEINGMISDVQMRSPHSFFEVDVVAPGGTTETWEVEAHALPILRRLGMTSDTMRVGDEVTIRGPRSRRPEKTSFVWSGDNHLDGATIRDAGFHPSKTRLCDGGYTRGRHRYRSPHRKVDDIHIRAIGIGFAAAFE